MFNIWLAKQVGNWHLNCRLTLGAAPGGIPYGAALHGSQGLEGMYCKFVDQFLEAIDACTEAVGQACRAALMGTAYARHGLRIEPQRSGGSRLIAILLAGAAMLQPSALLADTVPVRHPAGLVHGFLVLRTLEGRLIRHCSGREQIMGRCKIESFMP